MTFTDNLRRDHFTNIDEFVQAVRSQYYERVAITKSEFNDGKRRQYRRFAYNIPCAFDTETTSTIYEGDKIAFMYVWQLAVNGLVCVGRTWDEYVDLINKLSSALKTGKNNRLIVYVHNFNFDWQFLRSHFDWEEVFAVGSHDVTYACDSHGIEYRCSLKLTNKSLATVGKDLIKYKREKLVGELDYDLVRHNRSPLSKKEMDYCCEDVRVLSCAIQEKIEEEKDGVLGIPLTQTGYVRRYCRSKVMESKQYKRSIRKLQMSPREYSLLRKAFAGGFTHTNAKWVGLKIPSVDSYDVTSDYPTIMCCSDKFAVSNAQYMSSDHFNDLNDAYLTIFTATFINLRAAVDYDHILSSSKCEEVKPGDSLYWVKDNGRIVSARRIRTTMCSIDFENFKRFYTWDRMIVKNHTMMCYRTNYLPEEYVNCVLDFYEKKTTLKDVTGSTDEETMAILQEYQRSKGMLNSCYGMICESVVKDSYIYEDSEYVRDFSKNEDKILADYNKSGNRFIFYPWAITVCAEARKIIWDAIYDELKDDYIYADTDSLKMVNGDKHKKYFDDYNTRKIKQLKEAMRYLNIDESRIAPKNGKGKEKPLGVFDYEGRYDFAKFLGAKRYMVQKDGEIQTTIAGLSKKEGRNYICSQKDPWEFFDDEMYIPAENSGKSTHTYIDNKRLAYITDYLGNPAEVCEETAVHLSPCEFSLGLAEDYKNYLLAIEGSFIHEA